MKPQRNGAAARAPSKPEKPRDMQHDPKGGWDHVDEASWESFPASDPPGDRRGHDKPEKPPTLNGEEEEQRDAERGD